MTLGVLWLAILAIAGLGASLFSAGAMLQCIRKEFKAKDFVRSVLSSTGTVLVFISFYVAFVVATTELVVIVAKAFE